MTRLQELRLARSDALRQRFAFELETMRRLVGCAGCGCEIDSYTFGCTACWDRARRRVDGKQAGEQARADARAYLTENTRRARVSAWQKTRPD